MWELPETPLPPELQSAIALAALIGTGVYGIYTVWARVVRPLVQSARDLVSAIRQIADDFGQMRLLLAEDILGRLKQGDVRFDRLDSKLQDISNSVAHGEKTLQDHIAWSKGRSEVVDSALQEIKEVSNS